MNAETHRMRNTYRRFAHNLHELAGIFRPPTLCADHQVERASSESRHSDPGVTLTRNRF
jgi:hypothetical protein